MKRLALVLAAGLAYALAFPPYNLAVLIAVCLVPLLLALKGSSGRQAFGLGFAAGFVAKAGQLYWLSYVMNIYGGTPLALAAFNLLFLLAMQASYWGFFACLARRQLNNNHAIVTLPGLWLTFELFGSYLPFGGFPWGLAGHALVKIIPLVQLAELGGVYLLSGLALMANVAVYRGLKRDFKPLLLFSLCLLAALSFGFWRINTFQPDGASLKVGVAQANIAQDQKWRPEQVMPTLDTYGKLSMQAKAQGAQIVIWPEQSCTFFLFLDWQPTMKLIEYNRRAGIPFMVGGTHYDADRYYPRMWLMQNGRIEGSYDKYHLVPFGEYLPLKDLLKPLLGGVSDQVGEFTPGTSLEPIGPAGVMICYESLFADLARQQCLNGAGYLVNASNDAWYKTWSACEQLLNMTILRAVENRRWLLRSVNHGISAAIDPCGRVVKSIGLEREGVFVQTITTNYKPTFYATHGPLLGWLWALSGLVAALTIRLRTAKGAKP